FFNRDVRAVDEWNSVAFAKRERHAYLVLAFADIGVARIGAALVANRAEAIGIDGEPVQFCAVPGQRLGDLPALEVFIGQRVVGGVDAVLHRHIQAARGFAAARNADQDDLGLAVVIDLGAIVVLHRVVHGVDTLLVEQLGAATVAASHSQRRIGAERLFQRRQKR